MLHQKSTFDHNEYLPEARSQAYSRGYENTSRKRNTALTGSARYQVRQQSSIIKTNTSQHRNDSLDNPYSSNQHRHRCQPQVQDEALSYEEYMSDKLQDYMDTLSKIREHLAQLRSHAVFASPLVQLKKIRTSQLAFRTQLNDDQFSIKRERYAKTPIIEKQHLENTSYFIERNKHFFNRKIAPSSLTKQRPNTRSLNRNIRDKCLNNMGAMKKNSPSKQKILYVGGTTIIDPNSSSVNQRKSPTGLFSLRKPNVPPPHIAKLTYGYGDDKNGL